MRDSSALLQTKLSRPCPNLRVLADGLVASCVCVCGGGGGGERERRELGMCLVFDL